jgi:hypothetical protein
MPGEYFQYPNSATPQTPGQIYQLPTGGSFSGDIVGSKSLSTAYQNTTSDLLFVMVDLTGESNGSANKILSDTSPSLTTPVWDQSSDGGGNAAMLGVVLPNMYYEAVSGSGTLSHWFEYSINLASSSLGNLSSTRILETVYQNTSAKDILVIAGWPSSSDGAYSLNVGSTSSVSNGLDTLSTSSSGSGHTATMMGVIHPGQYYKMTRDSSSGTLEFWYEITLN